MSAPYELIEIAVRDFVQSARGSGAEERFLTEAAVKHGLSVHFRQCPNLVATILSLHIVNVHEAFERFLKALRIEAGILLQLSWKDYDKKDALTVALMNVFGDARKGRTKLGKMQIDLCRYYRLIRNAAVHDDREPAELATEFNKVKGYREEAAKEYETIGSAPNPPDELTRDDFQLFIRVAQ
jgi:hypothetical protein